MGTVHTVAVHFRYDYYMRRLANEFLCRNPIARSSPQEDHHRAVAVVIRGLPPDWKRPLGRPSHTALWTRQRSSGVYAMKQEEVIINLSRIISEIIGDVC